MVVSKVSQSCLTLSQRCLKVVPKMSESCPKVVPKVLFQSCLKTVPKQGSATVTSPLETAVRVAQLVALLHEEKREKEVRSFIFIFALAWGICIFVCSSDCVFV